MFNHLTLARQNSTHLQQGERYKWIISEILPNCEVYSTYQSHTKYCWLKRVRLGQKNVEFLPLASQKWKTCHSITKKIKNC
jgi:hypothetical protein